MEHSELVAAFIARGCSESEALLHAAYVRSGFEPEPELPNATVESELQPEAQPEEEQDDDE